MYFPMREALSNFSRVYFFSEISCKMSLHFILRFFKIISQLRVGIFWNSGFFDLEWRSTGPTGKTVRRILNFLFDMNSQVDNANVHQLLCIKNINKMAARIFWKWKNWKPYFGVKWDFFMLTPRKKTRWTILVSINFSIRPSVRKLLTQTG